MKFSLVIPCYNESKNLPFLLSKCSKLLENKVELIIVNNGSKDNSKELMDKIKMQYPQIIILHIKKNIGYGHGILSGLKLASGEVMGWCHADLQTNPNDFLKAIKYFKHPSQKIYIKGVRKNRNFYENLYSVGMSIIASLLLTGFYWDINAQPTVFTKAFLKKWKNPPVDFSLDLFSFYMANKHKLEIVRFPVSFEKRLHGETSWNFSFISKFNLIKKTIKTMFVLRK